jgi:arginine deiminase
MLFDFHASDAGFTDELVSPFARVRWGVDSEFGHLRDVLLCEPPHLKMVPCNEVTRDALNKGLACCTDTAEQQHAQLVQVLEAEGVRCHFVAPHEGLPDLSFTRDTVLMSPWGLIELNPRLPHRKAEVAHAVAAVKDLGIPWLASIDEGSVEGGDVCILKPGVIVIGVSGERTDEAGAKALARQFEQRGWRALFCRFDPKYLHLDTLFSVIDRDRAVACIEALPDEFLIDLIELGIEFIPASVEEVQKLGANLVSLGGGRVLSPADNVRLNQLLDRMGYEVIPVALDQFTRCGGGVHCLTMPLSRAPGR